MSSDIEKKIVEIEFENRNFEKSIKKSQKSIKELNESLKLKDADKSIEQVQKSLNSMHLDSLDDSVKKISDRFSDLGIVGTTALMRITNAAITTGKNLVKSFTVDPLTSGLQEYETQMNSVQTILANTKSKGTTLEQVNAALDELNHYADQTIYNFTEMTRNIGTFTAAGVDLNRSVNAIQGIANLAAVSGSNAQQASSAMYQLSQALSSGRVALQDWNSMVTAGISGEVFQKELRKTSEALGTGAEEAIKAKGNFRLSLETGWLTADVLTETLKKFTTSGANEWVADYTGLTKEAVEETLKAAEAQYGEAEAIEEASKQLAAKSGKNQQEIKDILELAKTAEDAATKVKTFSQLMDTLKESVQSGWSETWKTVIGDFEEAKELFTSIKDAIDPVITRSAELRNTMLKVWKSLGGRTKLLEGLANISNSILDVWNAISQAFYDVFGIVGSELYEITERFAEFTKELVVNEQTMEDIKRVVRGLASILNIITQLVVAVIKVFGQLFIDLKPLLSLVLHFFAILGDGITIIMYILKQTGVLDLVTKSISRTLLLVIQIAQNLLRIAAAAGLAIFDAIFFVIRAVITLHKTIQEKFGGIGGFISHLVNQIRERFPAIGKIMDTVSTAIGSAGQTIKDAVTSIKETVSGEGDGGSGGTNKLSGVWEAIKKVFGGVADVIINAGKTIGVAVKTVLEWFSSRNWMGAFITITTLSLLILGLIKMVSTIYRVLGGLANIVSTITNTISNVGKSISKYMNAKAMEAQSNAILNVAKAVALLAGSLIALSFVDAENLKSTAITLGIFTVVVMGLTAAVEGFSRWLSKKGKITESSGSGLGSTMLAMAVSMVLIIKAVSNMQEEMNKTKHYGDASFTDAMKSLIGGFAVLMILATVMNGISKKISSDSTTNTIAYVFQLMAVVSALKKLSDPSLDLGKGAIGLLAVGGFLASFIIVEAIASKFSSTGGAWKNMLASAIALRIVLSTMLTINNYRSETIISALGKTLGVIIMFRMVVKAASKAGANDASKNIKAIGLAFLELVLAMKMMCNLKVLQIKRGTQGVMAMLLPMTGLMLISKIGDKEIKTSAKTILAMSGAIMAMTLCASLLSLLDTDDLIKGTVAVSAMTAVMGGVIALTRFVNKAKNGIKTMIAMAAIVGVLTISAAVLSSLDIGKIIASFSGIAVVFGMMTLIFLSLKNFKASAAAGIVAMIVPIGAVAAALAIFSVLEVDSTIENAIALSVVLLTLSACMTILGQLPLKGVLVGCLGLTLAGVALIAVFGLFSLLIHMLGDGSAFVTGAQVIGDCIGALVGGIIEGVGKAATSMLPGLGTALTQFMDNIQGFISGSENMKNVDFGPLFGLAGLVGTLGFASIGAGGVASLGVALDTFGTGLNNFITATESIDATKFDTVSMLFSGVGNLVLGLTGFSSESLASFGAGLPALATNIAGFCSALMGEDGGASISSAMATEAAKIFAAFAIVASLVPKTGGLIGLVAGNADLGAFAAAMGSTGPAIKQFTTDVAGLQYADAEGGLKILQAAINAAHDVPNEGGLLGLLAGENPLSGFTEMMVEAGPDIVHFYNWVKGLEYSKAEGALKILKEAALTAQQIPNEGGLLGLLAGENPLSGFTEMMVEAGPDIVHFYNWVKGIDAADAKDALSILAATIAVARSIPNTGGVAGFFAGNNDLSTFTAQMALAGEDIRTFIEAMTFNKEETSDAEKTIEDTTDVYANAGKAVTILGDVIKAASSVDMQNGWEQFWGGDDSLTAFGKDLSTFAPYFVLFLRGMDAVDITGDDITKKMDAVVDFLGSVASFAGLGDSTLPDMSKDAGFASIYSLMTGMAEGVKDPLTQTSMEKIGDAIVQLFRATLYPDAAKWTAYFFIQNFGTKLAEEVVKDKDYYVDIGEDIVNTVGSAFEGDVMDGAAEKFSDGLINAVEKHLGIESPSKKFQEIGVYIVSGLSLGLQNGNKEVQKSADNMASTLENTFRDDMEIHSPSGVFADLGGYIVDGLKNGLSSGGSMTDIIGSVLGDVDFGSIFGDYGTDMANIFSEGLGDLDFSNFSFEGLDDGSFVNSLLAKVQDQMDEQGLTADVEAVFDADAMQKEIDSLGLTTKGTGGVANATMDSFENTKFEDSQGSESSGKNSFSFVQNNYSPTALDRIVIYRQTRNQFAAMKEVINKI